MPVFINQRWGKYRIHTDPSDIVRLLATYYTFGILDIPYTNRSKIKYNLIVSRMSRRLETKLRYEWIVCDREETKQYGSGSGVLNTAPWYFPFYWERINNKAINVGRLSLPIGYKVKLKVSNEKDGSSDYMTISEFTLRDWDIFNTETVYPILIPLFIGIIGWLIGWFLRGL